MDKMTLKDVDVSGKKVLVRVDFNVPFDEDTGVIHDDSRIRAALPTINYLTGQGAKVILASHLGRPDGLIVENLRMKIVAPDLSKLLGKEVITTTDCVGPEVEQAVAGMKPGDVLLLENLRFHIDEEADDPAFSANLAKLADVYVDDAFGTAHRKHASIVGVTKYLPAVAGFLMENELTHLGSVTENPERPFGGIFGGFKVSDKLDMLKNVVPRVDYALIGGAMVATFLKAEGYSVGTSVFEQDQIQTAKNLMNVGSQVVLPVDVVVSKKLDPASEALVVDIDSIPADQMILDIGPRSSELFCEKLQDCRTVFWNGPLGVNEIKQFSQGTRKVANFLAEMDASVIIGGGSTSDVVTNMGLADKMTFVSTGGGASLRFLSGKTLPGVEALMSKK